MDREMDESKALVPLPILEQPSSSTIPSRCHECDETFENFHLHQISSTPAVPEGNCKHLCPICGKLSLSVNNLRKHVSRCHLIDKNTKYSCESCQRAFQCASQLQKHTNNGCNGKPKQYRCGTCGKLFRNEKYFKRCEDSHITGKDPNMCEICGKVLSNPKKLRRHTLIHTDRQRLMCGYCGDTFVSLDSLKYHEKNIHDIGDQNHKPFSCEECVRSFSDSHQLRLHNEAIHSDKKLYVCHICGIRFKQNGSIRRHIAKHHNIGKCRPEKKRVKKPEYTCQLCGKMFDGVYHLKRHILTHMEKSMRVKPFKCSVCPKRYYDASALKIHKEKHI